MRSQELMSSWADWNGTQRRWTMPTGSVLQFCHCKNEEDVFNYMSQQFDIILLDESTQFTRFIYRYLLSRNRATKDRVTPFMAMATNPGNVGHSWFKSEFVDCGPPEQVHSVEVEEGVFEDHIFIPAFLSDNEILEKRDPMYRKKLESQPEIYKKQLLEGDWDIFAGQYFSEFRRNIHVCKPFDIPKWWKRFRSLDYGLDMTACYWWAVSTYGICYIYRELHQLGLRLSEAAKKILAMTPKDEKIAYTVASPDLWNKRQETGTSGREIMAREGLFLTKAKHDRIAGWRTLREYLAPYEDEQGILTARLQIFDHCINLIRCLPQLLHDEHNPEDAADKPHSITHGPESVRYGIMSRPSKSVDDSLKFTEGMSESAKKGVIVNLEFERKYREELAQHRVRW
ncbi:MAG: Terminase-like family protein [Pelotomaculum sp. PtaB.Bin104]|nr:MAG: Terminase-like family protein [Pelotomaculum sp. PtaB.Bin104]